MDESPTAVLHGSSDCWLPAPPSGACSSLRGQGAFPGSQLPGAGTGGAVLRACLAVKRFTPWVTGLLLRVFDTRFAVSEDIFF